MNKFNWLKHITKLENYLQKVQNKIHLTTGATLNNTSALLNSISDRKLACLTRNWGAGSWAFVNPISLMQRKHLPLYYLFLIVFLCDIRPWQFYLFLIVVSEIIITIAGCFWRIFWTARFITFGLFAAVYWLGYVQGQPTEHAVVNYLFEWTKIGDIQWWYNLYDSAMVLDAVLYYFEYYFLTLYLPFFCQCLILFMPLVASGVCFLAGHLIGYVLAGYFASGAIFISALASYYIMFFYPRYRQEFLNNFRNESTETWEVYHSSSAGDSALQSSASYHPFEVEMIDPLSVPAFVNMKEAKFLNLWLDFGTFIRAPFFRANMEFVVDSVSIIMIVTITTISFLVHLYSIVYMKKDPHSVRFFALLSLFTFFMIVLVMAGNLVMLYIGWEGVGLSSFLLISFWYTRVQAQKAATKAILINKIGDMFLIFAASLITYFTRGSSTIATGLICVPIFAADTKYLFGTALDMIAMAIVVAAFVKSAQIFFHTWLADAMEGPTPVSALLHAATMVTAGVYLVIRFSPIIEFSVMARGTIFFVGFYTIIMSSLIAVAQYDIKKIIAYSTCSQLGLMFFACGLSAYDFALFHFFNHAFFKCLLFLLAGVIIHQLRNEQDIRRMGGIGAKMPVTHLCFLIASMSLVGMPGFSGATSKDMILHLVNFMSGDSDIWIVKLFLFSTNIIIYLTMAYAGRLYYYLFWGPATYNRRYFGPNYRDVAYEEKIYAFVFFFLAAMSIIGGRTFQHFFVNTSENFISIQNEMIIHNPYHDALHYDTDFKYIPFFLTAHALGLVAAAAYYIRSNKTIWYLPNDKVLYSLFCFFNRKCYFDDVYNIFIVRPLLKLSYIFNYTIEDGIFKATTVGVWKVLRWIGLARIYRMRFRIADHYFFTSVGLIILVYGAHILAA